MVNRWAARLALFQLLIVLGIGAIVRAQDYRMGALESRVANVESLNIEKRLTRLETQFETIEWWLKALLGAVIIQLTGSGFTLFQRLAVALAGERRRTNLVGRRVRDGNRDPDADDGLD
jgi:hypothetical protein